LLETESGIRMNICYVANSIEIPYRGGKGSGGATHVYEVAKGLVDRGIRFICFAAQAGDRLKAKILPEYM